MVTRLPYAISPAGTRAARQRIAPREFVPGTSGWGIPTPNAIPTSMHSPSGIGIGIGFGVARPPSCRSSARGEETHEAAGGTINRLLLDQHSASRIAGAIQSIDPDRRVNVGVLCAFRSVAPPPPQVLAGRTAFMHPQRHEGSRGEASRELLLRRVAAGDQSAMAEFYDQTSAVAFGLALRILGDHAAAEDVVLEVYVQVWKQAAAYDASRGSPSAWLLALTRSRAIDQRRSLRRDRATEPLEAAADISTDAPGPETLTVAAERHRFVQKALGSLNAELREVICLAYFGGFSHSEIARELGQPLGTVKTRIRTGMIQLRALLAPLNAPLPVAKEDRS